ncbi:hydroxyacid dehydrogenase [Ruania albidiflava]|uniref:hydroxyacid dehydrogenase n=1 Tax=Ruania albidiflava TaxID=366586 RepID=UPI0003B4EAE2|nr:hydroxyacid dehydrogenase [Ruania albidiflava]
MRSQEFQRLFDESAQAALHRLGTVEFAPDADRTVVPHTAGDRYDVLVTSWSTAPFSATAVRGGRLRLAVHAAGSVRKLFPPELLDGDLRLCQGGAAPMAVAVAEMSVTLTLMLLRNVQIHDRGLQTTRDWQRSGHGMLGHGVHGRRIGVVGLSRVGQAYVRMITGLGGQGVRAYDPYASAGSAADLGVELTGLDDLCRTSDVLAVCAPATPQTHHLVGADQLRLLPTDAVLVNAGRSALVDQEALTAELVSGRIRAGLDVFDAEPLPAEHPLYGLENVVLTPHVAGGTVEARFGQGAEVVAEISRFLRGEDLEHEVTQAIYNRLA